MKIQIISDLHLEFKNDISQVLHCTCDMLIIAGDVLPGPKVFNQLTQIYKFHKSKPRIIFIPGNHEYYGYSKHELDTSFETFDYMDDIYILNNHIVEFVNDDLTILGGTGWWDESNGKIGFNHVQSLNDFKLIKDIYDNDRGIEWGKECRTFFEEGLECVTTDKVICVSHNGPTKKSHPKYHGSHLNTLFQNDWKDLIEYYQPDYWIYGHTHEYMDYKVDKTRCICNPMGYPREPNEFYPSLTIEI